MHKNGESAAHKYFRLRREQRKKNPSLSQELATAFDDLAVLIQGNEILDALELLKDLKEGTLELVKAEALMSEEYDKQLFETRVLQKEATERDLTILNALRARGRTDPQHEKLVERLEGRLRILDEWISAEISDLDPDQQ